MWEASRNAASPWRAQGGRVCAIATAPRVEGTLGIEGGCANTKPCNLLWVWHSDKLPPKPTVSWRLEDPRKAKCVLTTCTPSAVGRLQREAGPHSHSSVLSFLIGSQDTAQPQSAAAGLTDQWSDQPWMGSKLLSQADREPGLWQGPSYSGFPYSKGRPKQARWVGGQGVGEENESKGTLIPELADNPTPLGGVLLGPQGTAASLETTEQHGKVGWGLHEALVLTGT